MGGILAWIAGQGARSFLAAYWKPIALGAIILVGGIWYWTMHVKLQYRAAEIARLEAAVAERDAALKSLRDGYKANMHALQNELAAAQRRADTNAKLKEQLSHARPQDDGPAVILDDLLDSLQRERAGAGG